jgi:hypothetical protein
MLQHMAFIATIVISSLHSLIGSELQILARRYMYWDLSEQHTLYFVVTCSVLCNGRENMGVDLSCRMRE